MYVENFTDMESRCRLCAENNLKNTDLIHILEDPQSSISQQIYELFRIEITIDDDLPTTVCTLCYEIVEKTWDFHQKVQKSQDLLLDLLNNASLSTFGFEDEAKEIVCCIMPHTIEYEQNLEQIQIAPPVETDNSENKAVKVKSETKKVLKKKRKNATESIPELKDAVPNNDGSISPKCDITGWESYPWICYNCQQSLTNSEDLRDHYATIHGQSTKYCCSDCAKIYTKYSTFLAHVRVHQTKLKYCCDLCHKWFPSVSSQEKHRSQHTDEKPHICTNCGKSFRMQSALLVHARSHLPAELKNRYQCDQCPKRFGTKPNLMAHKRIHAGVKDYTCDQCGKSFVQKGNLDNHLLTHTAAKPYPCNVCGKSFKTLVRLKKHGSVHSGLKPHQCDICGRQFREKGTLKEHHRIHTGAMPFTCEFCGKNFRFKGVLTTHRRQHTGERPYSCFECQHHFTNWPNYNKHMKRRHGINTSVTVRKPQTIPPTGMPYRNPPGTVLAPPQPLTVPDTFVEPTNTFYPVLSLYNLPDDLLQQRV